MTALQIVAITAASLTVGAKPSRAWGQLSADEQTAYGAALDPPAGGFTADQRSALYAWWMPVTAAQMTSLNALAPSGTILAARADTSGNLYLPFYVLSDTRNGRRLTAMQSILTSLVIVSNTSITWPVPAVTQP